MYGLGIWGAHVSKGILNEINQVVYAAGRLILGQSLKARTEAVARLAEISLAEESVGREAAALWTRAWSRNTLDSFRGAVQRGAATWAQKGYEEATAAGINTSRLEPDFYAWYDENCDVAEAIRDGRLAFGTTEPSPDRVEHSHQLGSVTYTAGAAHRAKGSWAVVRYDDSAGGDVNWGDFQVRSGTVDSRADSFVAEQKSLHEALKWEVAERREREAPAPGRATFWTDSLGNVLSLDAPTVRDQIQESSYKLIAELLALGVSVEINWVRSHGHSVGNSLADLYAAEAQRADGATTVAARATARPKARTTNRGGSAEAMSTRAF
jgi:ribonuclease HI